jgi:hypothetical protein
MEAEEQIVLEEELDENYEPTEQGELAEPGGRESGHRCTTAEVDRTVAGG